MNAPGTRFGLEPGKHRRSNAAGICTTNRRGPRWMVAVVSLSLLWAASARPERAWGEPRHTTLVASATELHGKSLRGTTPAAHERILQDAPRLTEDPDPVLQRSQVSADGPEDAGVDRDGGSDGGAAPTRYRPLRIGHGMSIRDPGGMALRAFHRALRRASSGEGKARIAFYGASHVASDLFTGLIRRKLQERFGEGGAGFVVPARPWRWYRNAMVDFGESRGWRTRRIKTGGDTEGIFGLAGAAVETRLHRRARTSFSTRRSERLSGHVSSFELFYMKQPEGGSLIVRIDGKFKRRIRTDSRRIGPGYARFEVEQGEHTFELRTKKDGPVRVFGVALERGDAGVVLDTLGIPGARARFHLKWEDQIYRAHLARRAPDLVVLAYGTNESGDRAVPIASYERRLRQVIARIQQVAPESSCLLVGPSDRPLRVENEAGERRYVRRRRVKRVNDVQRRVSEEMGCGFFDLLRFMGGPMSMPGWVRARPSLGAPDHVHFTRAGYQLVGETLHGSLVADYERSIRLDDGAGGDPASGDTQTGSAPSSAPDAPRTQR